jgi:hypothetical protein
MFDLQDLHDFQDGISSETYRKFNFKISLSEETLGKTTINCPPKRDAFTSLSFLHCCIIWLLSYRGVKGNRGLACGQEV